MPRSRAITGAFTMLTEVSCGRSTPISATCDSGLTLSCANVALVLDRHRLDVGVGELAGERAQLSRLTVFDRAPAAALPRPRHWHVERVDDGAGQEIVRHLLGDLQGDVLLRLDRGRAEMGRADEIGRAEQHVVLAGSSVKTSKPAPAM